MVKKARYSMEIKDENEKEKEIMASATPYQRLHYIYELCSFYKAVVEIDGDFAALLKKILTVTEKYKKI